MRPAPSNFTRQWSLMRRGRDFRMLCRPCVRSSKGCELSLGCLSCPLPRNGEPSAHALVKARQLLRQKAFDESLHRADVDSTLGEGRVGRLQRFEVWISIFHDLVWNRRRARKLLAGSDGQNDIRRDPGRSSVAVSERMNPIQPPHDIRGEMNWGSRPVVVHMVAHFFHQSGHQVLRRRPVFAFAYLHGARPIDARIRTDSRQGFAVKRHDGRRAQFEISALDRGNGRRDSRIVLPQTVASLDASKLNRIADYRGFKSPSVPSLPVAVRHSSPDRVAQPPDQPFHG
jgi:hypothetical protein